MKTVAECRKELHELFMRYSGEGYRYNEAEINKLLDDFKQAVMMEYYEA